MKYTINLFGYQCDVILTFNDETMQISITEEDQKALKAYLIRTIPRYGQEPVNESSLKDLVQQSIAIEKQINARMSEPRIKLPYEFQPIIKEKLVEAAELQNLSATQLLIRLIEKKYKEVMNQGG